MSDISKIDEGTRKVIRDISSSFARANGAKTDGDTYEEIKYLLYAMQDIGVLIHRNADGRTTDDEAKSYAATLVSSSARIRDIMFARGK